MLTSSLSRCSMHGWAATLGLLLVFGRSGTVQAQVAPAESSWKIAPGTLVYLDGERSTKLALDRLMPNAFASAEKIKDKAIVQQLSGDSVATAVLVVTTKANWDSPAVLALADKAHLASSYVSKPSTMQVIAPKALAYITSHYPKCWLGGEVMELTQKSTGAVKYRVQLADNWICHYVSFTLAGDFVDDRFN